VELGRRQEGAAAVAVHHRSQQRTGEHGGQTRARASVCYGESICIPEWAGDPVEGAVDDGVKLGRLR
jgi:hypothetical protein